MLAKYQNFETQKQRKKQYTPFKVIKKYVSYSLKIFKPYE